jgi:hypothetical protein
LVKQVLLHDLLDLREGKREADVQTSGTVEEEPEAPMSFIGVVVGVGEEEAVTSGGGLEAVKTDGGASHRWQCHPRDRTRVRSRVTARANLLS